MAEYGNGARSQYAIVFLDLQEEIVKNARTISLGRLKAASAVLAKLAALHRLPVFASAVPPGGAYLSSIRDALATLEPRPRTQTTAFADDGLVRALKESGRRTLVLAGVATEIVVTRTALDAREAGFHVTLAVDACGGVDARTEDAAFRRLTAAGVDLSSTVTVAADLTGDFTTSEGGQTLGLAYEAIGAASA